MSYYNFQWIILHETIIYMWFVIWRSVDWTLDKLDKLDKRAGNLGNVT